MVCVGPCMQRTLGNVVWDRRMREDGRVRHLKKRNLRYNKLCDGFSNKHYDMFCVILKDLTIFVLSVHISGDKKGRGINCCLPETSGSWKLWLFPI